VLKIAWIAVAVVCLLPATLSAQHSTYFGAMGGLATLSGDGSAVVTSQSASTSLFSPMNGGAADLFFGVHLFNYVSLQAEYGWNRNDVVLVSSSGSPGALSFYRQPQKLTQNAFLANVLVYFRKRGSRIRPYLSEGVGGVLIHSRSSGGGVSGGNPAPLPGSSDHASAALRTSVGLDVRLPRSWFFRYSFGETLTRNTFGDQLSPPEHRIPKNFQNLFGVYYQF
jgi:Outer membrane protein beta-barrel domain